MSSSLGTNQKARNESKALGWIVGYPEAIHGPDLLGGQVVNPFMLRRISGN